MLCLPLSGGTQMMKTTVAVSGMVCGMCETHVNDAIRAAFSVKKVSSSRTKGETVILSNAGLDRQELKRVIQSAGYIPLSISEEPYEKKRFFFIR